MSRLETCTGCGRHVRAGETRCPFCGVRPVVAMAAAVAIGVAAIACDRPQQVEQPQVVAV